MSKSRLELGQDTYVEVFHQGAHVSAWCCKGEEQLFLSESAEFRQGAAIRGGVPVIFPQFAVFGPGKKHGFARTALWQLEHTDRENELVFALASSDETKAIWPHAFSARFTVTLEEDALDMALSIENTDRGPFDFTAALHTYLRVADVREIRISGVQQCAFWDNDGSPFENRRQHGDEALVLDALLDRIYFDVKGDVSLAEGGRRRTISTENFPDVVIWNPWQEGAAALPDMEEKEYRHMICIEAVAVDHPIRLSPGAQWSGRQRIALERS